MDISWYEPLRNYVRRLVEYCMKISSEDKGGVEHVIFKESYFRGA